MTKINFRTVLLIIGFFYVFNNTSNAQDTNQDLHFQTTNSWSQALNLAKKQRKMVFVDCYTTWCGPCKEMDETAFKDPGIKRFLDSAFISIRVQMDSTKHDSKNIRAWYGVSRKMRQEYQVNEFPSFLFFSADGKIVHRWSGLLSSHDFLTVARDATQPQRQFYTKKRKFERHDLPPADMPYLAIQADILGQKQLAINVAKTYVNEYMHLLPEKQLLEPMNLAFLKKFTKSTSDPGYSFFSKFETKIDSVFGPGYSAKLQIAVLAESIVKPMITKDSTITWKKVEKTLSEKYPRYGTIAVLQERVFQDAFKRKNWADLETAFSRYYTVADTLNVFNVNTLGWYIFQHSSDIATLTLAGNVLKKVMGDDPYSIDTYANLLYKIGDVKNALVFENQARKLDSVSKASSNRNPDPVFAETITKMEKGVKTW